MRITALFFPAFISILIKYLRKPERTWHPSMLIAEYGIYVLVNVLLTTSLITYGLGIYGITADAFDSFPFFIKYTFIAIIIAFITPYVEELITRYVKVSSVVNMVSSVKRQILNLEFPIYIIISLGILFSYYIINKLDIDNIEIQRGMLICIILVAVYAVIKFYLSKLSYDEFIFLIIAAGFIMRIGYMLYTDSYTRVYDIGAFDYTHIGKAAYLLNLAQMNQLPQTNEVQLYHQPFSYIASALCSKILVPFLNPGDVYYLVDAGKTASCFASCAVLIMLVKACRLLNLSKISTLFTTLWLSFIPIFYLIGGRIGEDAFTCFFTVAALLYTAYWYNNPSYKNTILLAIIYGLGVQTSLSCVLPVPFTLFAFAYHIWKKRCKPSFYLKQSSLFAIIALPLGLWFSIRNYILFDQAFTYVYEQEIYGPLWTGDISLWNRYKFLDILDIRQTPYGFPFVDYNFFTFHLKTELFGIFTFEIPVFIPYVLLILNICITFGVIIYSIYSYCFGKVKGLKKLVLPSYLFILLFSMYSYYVQPFGCSMDYRYFAALSVLKALLLGMQIDLLSSGTTKIGHFFKQTIFILIPLYSIASVIMFCFIVA